MNECSPLQPHLWRCSCWVWRPLPCYRYASGAALHRAGGVTRFQVSLPNTARAIRRGAALVIVAIGSSSTQGVGASDQAHTYPALLAEELRRRWPRLAVTVVNKGVGGENAEQMLARFTRDVLPYHPQLVIWQTGSNSCSRARTCRAMSKRSARHYPTQGGPWTSS